jgi:hypothetical protein
MQHIGMQRETEGGELIATFRESGIDVRIVARAPASSCCLRFIDPYGDTVINQLQLPVLVAELRELRDSCPEADLREHIEEAITFIEESKDDYSYIRFLGD